MSIINTNGEDLTLNADAVTKKINLHINDALVAYVDSDGIKNSVGAPYVEGVTGNLVNNTDVANPIVTGVEGVTGNLVNNADVANPVVNLYVDKVLAVAASTAATALDGTLYDSFVVTPSTNTTLTVTMDIGRTVTIFLVNPSTHVITWRVAGNTYYWWNGAEIISPDTSGITTVTITRLDGSSCVLSGQTGYLSV